MPQQELEIYDPPGDVGKDYVLQVKIKNGPLLRAMRAKGYASVSQFCLKTGLPAQIVYEYLRLARAPLSRRGEWHKSALNIAKHLQLPPDCLFPEQHLTQALAKASGEIEISREEVSALIEHNNDDPEYAERREQLCSSLEKMMLSLSPREERVLRLRHGFNGGEPKIYETISKELNITRERVRQIEFKAYRKLQRVKNVKTLADVGYTPADKWLADKRERDELHRAHVATLLKEKQAEQTKERLDRAKEIAEQTIFIDRIKTALPRECPKCQHFVYWEFRKLFSDAAAVCCSHCSNIFICDLPEATAA